MTLEAVEPELDVYADDVAEYVLAADVAVVLDRWIGLRGGMPRSGLKDPGVANPLEELQRVMGLTVSYFQKLLAGRGAAVLTIYRWLDLARALDDDAEGVRIYSGVEIDELGLRRPRRPSA